MVLKTKQNTSEFSSDLLENMPLQLRKEVKSFMQRNSLTIIVKGETLKKCCHRCLKAHIIRHARKLGERSLASNLAKALNVELGHNGYYLDQGKLNRL